MLVWKGAVQPHPDRFQPLVLTGAGFPRLPLVHQLHRRSPLLGSGLDPALQLMRCARVSAASILCATRTIPQQWGCIVATPTWSGSSGVDHLLTAVIAVSARWTSPPECVLLPCPVFLSPYKGAPCRQHGLGRGHRMLPWSCPAGEAPSFSIVFSRSSFSCTFRTCFPA